MTGDFSKSQFVHVVELSQHLISNNCLICVFSFLIGDLAGFKLALFAVKLTRACVLTTRPRL